MKFEFRFGLTYRHSGSCRGPGGRSGRAAWPGKLFEPVGLVSLRFGSLHVPAHTCSYGMPTSFGTPVAALRAAGARSRRMLRWRRTAASSSTLSHSDERCYPRVCMQNAFRPSLSQPAAASPLPPLTAAGGAGAQDPWRDRQLACSLFHQQASTVSLRCTVACMACQSRMRLCCQQRAPAEMTS